MSFLRSIFGGSPEKDLNRAEEHIAAGQWGDARLLLGRLLKKIGKKDAPLLEEVERKLAEVTAHLARSHEAEGDRLYDSGMADEAVERYHLALSLFEEESDRERVEEKLSREAPNSAPPLSVERLFVDENYCPGGQCSSDHEAAVFEGDPKDYFEILVHTLDPDRAEAYRALGEDFALAYAYTNLEDFSKAISCYEKALQAHPDHPILHKEMGRALLFLGESERAVASLRRAWESDPKDLELGYVFASALHEREQGEEALSVLDRLLEAHPDEIGAFLMMGDIHLKAGDMERSLERYRAVLEVDPEFPEIHSRLGEWAVAAGDRKQAIEHFSEAVEYGNNARDMQRLADLHLAEGHDPEIALGLLNNALYLDPENRWTYLLRIGEVYLKKGWKQEGMEILEQVQEKIPEDQEEARLRLEALLTGGANA
ncbi:MAG: tetratricopeptide repeat protein [Deltaproteobacteria bacterium]|nr:tetratricopeptide repeat protein [Deltaproteobacteria bacterium]